ncbi:glycosyltransferase family 9 protein [candidate division KSB1 bacterium]
MKEKILFFRPDHIGDLLLTTPAICSFRKSFPDAHITTVVGSWSNDILTGNPYIDDLINVNLPWLARGSSASYYKLIKQCAALRKDCFDHIFSFRTAAKSALISRLFGGKKRWGFNVQKSRWAFNVKVPYDPKKHVVENYLDIMETFGADRSMNSGPEIFISNEEKNQFSAKFTFPSSYAVLSPGAGYPPKLWITERWAAVADWLSIDCKIPVIMTGTNFEKPLVYEIQEQMKGEALNLCGNLSLRELAILIERSRLLLTVDSAAMHIAAVVNTPQTALFGFTNPIQWGPYPQRDTHVVLYKPLKKALSCENMEQISVKDVIKSADGLLSLNH